MGGTAPEGLIAIMAGNRLVTTETENVPIRSTTDRIERSNVYDFASRRWIRLIIARHLAVATRLAAIVTAKGKLRRGVSERKEMK